MASDVVTTLLFTDIEGSTRLWDQQAERMSGALACHDKLARAAVADNRGVVIKLVGDGVYATFDDPLDALNASVAMQLALVDSAATNGIPLRVRCGIHLGAVERRDNDLLGSSVNRAARIMSAAHGGQVLYSQSVVDKVRDRLPPDVTLRDLGTVRLRDLGTPERVYQLVHPQLRQDFPALRSLESTPNNLPQQLTSFIGREREVTEAKELLTGTRVLTLLGMGGLGKTRLSLQIGADVMDAYPDGVWFIDLAPTRDPSLVPSVTAQALGVAEEPGKSLTQTLCAHVKDRQLLLILDNCEHLVSACASLADALLRGAAGIKILATSREALHIPGEQTYPVLPMVTPDPKAGIEALSRSEAVQLFMERARLQKPALALTERDAPAIAELCARLEGIPLAMELAAARVRSLSVQDINARLKDRYKLLTGGARTLQERQQTLRALVAWSYDLLQENERLLFERLGVFAGTLDVPAAEEVCGTEPLALEDILDLLTSLVDKSLVMVDQSHDTTRYRMLVTLREYARERLGERGDLDATATRHCDYFLGLAKIARAELQGPGQAEWTRRLELDLDDVREGIRLALKGGVDPILAVKFEVALMSFRMLRGHLTEGRKNIRDALAAPAVRESDVAHANALYVGAALADGQGDNAEALRMLEECLELRRKLGRPEETAATLSTLSIARLHAGDAARAREGEEEAVAIFRELGDRVGEGIGLIHLGEIATYGGDFAGAREHFERCLAIARELDSREMAAECERSLGELALEAGDVPAAREWFERSLETCREAEDKRNEAAALWWLGNADLAGGDADAARSRLNEALRVFRDFEMNPELLGCLEDHARLLEATGAAEQAVRLCAMTAACRARLTHTHAPHRERRRQKAIDAARATLGDGAFEAAWKVPQACTLASTVRYALEATEGAPAAA